MWHREVNVVINARLKARFLVRYACDYVHIIYERYACEYVHIIYDS